MARSAKIKTAQQHYDAGLALFQENRHVQALVELNKAEIAFRNIDVRGHPFSNPLPNGVSGLANTLALEGMCYQKVGDFRKAARCFETSLINSPFEKKRPWKKFLLIINEHLFASYDKLLEKTSTDTLQQILTGKPRIDITYRFPFSLDGDEFTIARMYELSRERHDRFKEFYYRARAKDAELRRYAKKSDESSMRKMSFLIWGALFIIWAVYGIISLEALLKHLQ